MRTRLHAVADEGLYAEVRQLLAEMTVVADAPTSTLEPHVSHGKNEGGERPRGASETLCERWAGRFAQQTDARRIRVLLTIARGELAQIRHGVPGRPRDGAGFIDVLEDAQRQLDWYEGLGPEEAAALESSLGTSVDAAYFRKLRARNDRNPWDGRERPPAEHRERLARRLDAEGASERRIALELGVAKTTVRRILRRAA